VVSLIAPPRQPMWVIVVDGPDAFTRTWAFDEADQHYATIRTTISAGLPQLTREPA
jgi:hypothetical protein